MADGYLVLSLGGVQEFIAASRRTADLWTASRIVSRLCKAALTGIGAAGGEPVLPGSAASSAGLPNRVFAVMRDGDAADLAESAAVAVREEWARLAGLTFRSPSAEVSAALATFPSLRWVLWHSTGDSPGSVPGYEEGWRVCQLAVTARGRVRDFPAYAGRGRQPCSLCGKRDGEVAGSGVLPARLRVAAWERLCPVCAVKRDPTVTDDLAGERTPFPSTASVATAPFRLAIIKVLAVANDAGDGPDRRKGLAEAVRRHALAVAVVTKALRKAGAQSVGGPPRAGALPALDRVAQLVGEPVPDWVRLDGAWCLPDSWQPESLLRENGLHPPVAEHQRRALEAACEQGRVACTRLVGALRDAMAQPVAAGTALGPATYLAMVMQDADDMGRSLGPASMPDGWHDARGWHGEVSRVLIRVAEMQAGVLEEAGGRAVYAGGDDLLGLVSAAEALSVARGSRELFLAHTEELLGRRSVSTAVVFFHVSFPLQDALARARTALAAAKARPGKGGLAVVVLRRGGEKAAAVLPWRSRQRSDPAGSLEALAVGFRKGLSPRLVSDMYRSRHGIAELAGAGLDYGAEVRRLVGRHADAGSANAMSLVGAVEPAADRLSADDVRAWAEALDIARFVAQEAR